MAVCKECGLLGCLRTDNGEAIEATKLIRRKGRLRIPATGGNPLVEFYCHVKKRDFPDPNLPYSLDALTEPVDCNAFIEHIPSLTPRDHVEMELLAQVRSENERFKRDAETSANTRHEETIFWTRVIGIVAALSLLVSLAALYVSSIKGP